MLGYLCYYKVYTKQSYLVVTILNEIALIIVICLCFCFLDEEMSNPTAVMIGDLYIVFIIVVVALNTLWVLFTLAMDIMAYLKERKKKNKQKKGDSVGPDDDDDKPPGGNFVRKRRLSRMGSYIEDDSKP